MQRADAEAIGRAVGAKNFRVRHAMRIADLVLGSVQRWIRNIAGPARQIPAHQHADRVGGHRLAYALLAVVEQLPEPEAWIGFDLASAESAEAIHGDVLSAVFLHQ